MRLTEEKKLHLIGFGCALILIIHLGIQYADVELNNYNQDLESKRIGIQEGLLKINHFLLANHKNKSTANLITLLNGHIEAGTTKPVDFGNKQVIGNDDERHRKQWESVRNNEITIVEYYETEAKNTSIQYQNEINNYYGDKESYISAKDSGSIWTPIRNSLMFVELILILLVLYGYYFLYKQVIQRIR